MRLFKTFFLAVTFSVLPVNAAFAEGYLNGFPGGFPGGYPFFKGGVLTIPRVDTDAQAGSFQDVTLGFNEQTGEWRLLDFKETKPGEFSGIEKVEAIITDSFPVQVFLRVSGSLFCAEFVQINQRLNGRRFEVTMPPKSYTGQPGMGCVWMTIPFVKIIPLPVYDLSAGTYEYSVNGGNIGTFTLTQDNRL